jgi:molybdenum cofactor cytidylyltransferase
MGRPKLLLPWSDTSVLGHLLRTWEQLAVQQISVVLAADALVIEPELDRLGFPTSNRIYNSAPDRGMFSSIQCAAAWAGWSEELTHWIITLGDQPHLQPATLRALLEFGAVNPTKICQPLRNGRRKHPVLLPKREFMALNNSAATDLKQFLEDCASARAGFESEDAGLDLDIDQPEDYERALRLW